jgi:hypothetical protein
MKVVSVNLTPCYVARTIPKVKEETGEDQQEDSLPYEYATPQAKPKSQIDWTTSRLKKLVDCVNKHKAHLKDKDTSLGVKWERVRDELLGFREFAEYKKTIGPATIHKRFVRLQKTVLNNTATDDEGANVSCLPTSDPVYQTVLEMCEEEEHNEAARELNKNKKVITQKEMEENEEMVLAANRHRFQDFGTPRAINLCDETSSVDEEVSPSSSSCSSSSACSSNASTSNAPTPKKRGRLETNDSLVGVMRSSIDQMLEYQVRHISHKFSCSWIVGETKHKSKS